MRSSAPPSPVISRSTSMLLYALLTLMLLLWSGGVAGAASYQQIDGTIVDPTHSTGPTNHLYSGPNLEPYAQLQGAQLENASLYAA